MAMPDFFLGFCVGMGVMWMIPKLTARFVKEEETEVKDFKKEPTKENPPIRTDINQMF